MSLLQTQATPGHPLLQLHKIFAWHLDIHYDDVDFSSLLWLDFLHSTHTLSLQWGIFAVNCSSGFCGTQKLHKHVYSCSCKPILSVILSNLPQINIVTL